MDDLRPSLLQESFTKKVSKLFFCLLSFFIGLIEVSFRKYGFTAFCVILALILIGLALMQVPHYNYK